MRKITSCDFEKNRKTKTKRWLAWLSLCIVMLCGATSIAQVNAYSFTQSQGVFESIATTGDLLTGSAADAVTTYDTSGWDVALPFAFNFNSADFTSIYVNSNGGATFGLTSTSSSVISGTTAYSGAIGVMNRDLWGVFYTAGSTTTGSNVITNVASFRGIEVGKVLRTGSGVPASTTVTAFDQAAGTITMSNTSTSTTAAASIGWGTGKILTKIDGTAPNRVFTIQWEGYNDYSTAGSGSNYLSFQLKLAETSNTITIVYGDYANISTTSRTNQIGLRGAANTDFQNRTGAAGNPWSSTTAGATNGATVARDNVNFPAPGLTFTWSPPTCIPPGALSVTDITGTSATLNWTSTGTLFDIEWGPQSFTQGTGTIVTGVSAPYVLSGLNSSTAYKYYVRTNCGAVAGVSNWAGPFSFVTLCTTVTAFSENFDTYTLVGATNPLPNCWSRLGNTGSSYITTGSAAPLTPVNRLFLSASATTPTNAVAVMPAVSNLQAETHRLKFKAYSTTAGTSIEIGYYETGSDPLNFVVLETFAMPSTAQTTATEFIYTPQFVPAGVESIAFRVNGAAFTGTTTIYIDDVVWEPLPLCFDITDITFANIGATAVDFQWNPGGSETAWEYVYALSTVTSPEGLTPTVVNNNPFGTITNLLPSTSYKLWIRSNCGGSALGNWSSPRTFTTACAPVTALPWNEGFEGVATVGTTAFPPCWFKENGDWATAVAGTYNTPKSGTKYLRDSWTATNEYMWTPGFELTAGTSYDFSFFMQGDGFTGWTVDVFQNSLQNSVGAVQLGQTVTANGAGTIALQPYQFVKNTFVATTSGVYYFAIRVNQASSTPWYVAFDDFKFEVTPTCESPTIEPVTNLTSASATVSWSSPSTPANGFEYFVTTDTALVPNATTVPTGAVAGTVSFVNLSALSSSTVYKYFVRALCSASDVSSWSAAGTFTTACAPVIALPWNEGFEGVTTVGTTAFPPCWFKENGDWATAITGTYNTPKSGTKYIRNSWSATNEYMWTPGFELTAGTSYDFSFFMQGDGFTGWSVDVFQNTVQNSVGAVQVGTNVVANGSGTIAIQPYQFVNNTFVATTSGVYYFAVRVNQPSATPWYIAFDDFKFQVTPSCVAPLVATVSNVTSATATINWTSTAAPADGFQYFVTTDTALVPDATTVATGTVAGTVTSVTLTSLNATTLYKYFVKAVCSASDMSSWSNAGTFTTACDVVDTFTQNFDTSPTGTAAVFPTCWQKAGTGSTYVTTGGVAPGSAPNRLYMFATGLTTPTQAIAIMPPVSNLQAETHRLRFKAYSSSSATGRYLEVGYFTNTADLSTFTLVQTVNLPGTLAASAQTFVVNPANIPAGVTSLAFRNPGTPTASTTLYIDDVIWEAKPTIVPSCATTVTAVPNATCGNFATVISWTATADADGYYLTIGTTAGGSDVLSNQNVGPVLTYNFIGNINTMYYYTVTPFNSAGPALGCVEQSFMTALNGCYCTSVPTSNDGAGVTNVQVGTQNFPTGDVTYFDHTATTVDLAQGILSNLQVTLATGYTYNTNVWIDLNDNFNFEPSELFFQGEAPATNPTVQDASFLMPATAALGTHRMRIVTTDILQTPANPCYGGTYGVTLDFSVNVIATPTCFAPTALVLSAASLTQTSATVNWTAPTTGAASGYEYYVTATNVAPTPTTTPSGSVAAGVTTVSLSALTASTSYTVYVRSLCSATDFSAWSSGVNFTTLCGAATLPYTIDFESVTVPNLPLCTSIQNVGTGNNWVTASPAAYGFTNKSLRYSWNTTSAANVWFYTNSVNLVAGTQYSVSYKYGSSSTTYVESMKVAYGSAANSTAMTNVLADHASILGTTPVNNVVTFTPATSGSYVIGFQAYSAADQFYLLLDDIVIQEVLSTPGFDNNAFTAYPNPVKNILNVRYNENIKDATVYNLLGQQLFVKAINATEGQIDMSNLASGTYLVRVNSGDKVQTIKVIKE